MKTFKVCTAQGEIKLIRIGDIPNDVTVPNGFTAMKSEGEHMIIGHSETGHHHVMDARHVVAAVMDNPPTGMRVLQLIVSQPTALRHLREVDTHEPITVHPGLYEARLGREYDAYAEIARQVQD